MNEAVPPSPLARIAQRLRTHDWFAAAIEVAIVVLGIFLGFQVTQWNDERQSRAREVALMLNVAHDLREDVKELDQNVRIASSRMAALDHVLRLAGNWDPPAEFASSRSPIKVEPVAPFDTRAGYSFGVETFIVNFYDGTRFAYNALINADGSNVVTSQARLAEIQQYYAAADVVLNFDRMLLDDRLRVLDALQEAGLSTVDGASFERVAAVVRANPNLRAAIENYWFYANRQIALTRALSVDAARLAGRIEREYGASR